MVYTIGDFNARIQVKQDNTETAIGPYTFDPTNNKLTGQSDIAVDNRQRFLSFCHAHELHIMNTHF